jgi:protein transport protein SEC24
MVVMSDTDDPFVPLPDDLLVNLAESRGVFEGLLDAIPATFAANSQVGGGASRNPPLTHAGGWRVA